MKKNRYTYIFVCFVFIGLVCGGCRAKRNISISENIVSKNEKIEVKKDTSRVEKKSQTHQSTKTNEEENSYVRVTEYDSTGTVIRRIQEEWRDIGRSQLSLLDRSRNNISLDGMSSITVSSDSSRIVSTENKETISDSRLVQGVEWFWVILVLVLIISVVIFIIIKKKKNNGHNNTET